MAIGGKGHRKAAKSTENTSKKREIPFKEDDQEYAKIDTMLGDSRVLAVDITGISRVCTIRGSMRKRVWMRKGDTILISFRDGNNSSSRGDVIFKYSDSETQYLKKIGEIPDDQEEVEDNVYFVEEEDDIDAI